MSTLINLSSLNLSPRHDPNTVTEAQKLPKKLFTHLSGNDYQLNIDWSTLESFLSCDRASEFKLVYGRCSKSRSALTYGAAIHAGLEVAARGTRKLSDADLLKTAIAATEIPFIESPTEFGEWRNFESATETVKEYLSHYKGEAMQVIEHEGQPLIEVGFSMPLGIIPINTELKYGKGLLVKDVVHPDGSINVEDDVPLFIENLHVNWTGIIDKVVTVHNKIWVLDHKTTSMFGPDYFDDFELSTQPIGYQWAMEKVLGRPIDGYIIDVLVGRKPTKTGKGREFHRHFYDRSDWKLSEWPKNTLELVSDLVHNLVRGYFPQKTSHCRGKYGKCQYFDTCNLKPEQRLMYLYSDSYQDFTWSPI